MSGVKRKNVKLRMTGNVLTGATALSPYLHMVMRATVVGQKLGVDFDASYFISPATATNESTHTCLSCPCTTAKQGRMGMCG